MIGFNVQTILCLLSYVLQVYSVHKDQESPSFDAPHTVLKRQSRSVPNLRQQNNKHENVLGLYSRYPQMQSHRNDEDENKGKKVPRVMLKIDDPPKIPPADVSKMDVYVKTSARKPTINYSRPLPPTKSTAPLRHRLIDQSVTAYILQDYLQPETIREDKEECNENTQ